LCRHAAQRRLHGPVVGGTHEYMLTCACISVNPQTRATSVLTGTIRSA
jgi:hypothetical protein